MKKGIVPIAEGKRLAEKYAAPVVIVFSIHDGGDTFNVTTYGQTKKNCRNAADLAKKIAEAILDSAITPAPLEPTHLPDSPMLWKKEATE